MVNCKWLIDNGEWVASFTIRNSHTEWKPKGNAELYRLMHGSVDHFTRTTFLTAMNGCCAAACASATIRTK